MTKTAEFTLVEREELSRLLSQDRTLTNIAKLLSKDRNTISREVSRKGMNRSTYRAFGANQDAKCQKSIQGKLIYFQWKKGSAFSAIKSSTPIVF